MSKKAKSTKKAALSAKQKELKLVRQQFRRMEKRGYEITPQFKEEVSEWSWQKLRALRQSRYRYLFEKRSHYVTESGETKHGRMPRGTVTYAEAIRRSIEADRQRREESFKKSKSKDDFDAWWGGIHNEEDFVDTSEEEWEKNFNSTEEQRAEWREQFTLGNLALEIVNDIIDGWKNQGSGRFGIWFKKVLYDEIDRFGLANVTATIGSVPDDFLNDAHDVMFYSGDTDNLVTAMRNLYYTITGHMMDRRTNEEFTRMFEEEFSSGYQE